MKYEDWSIDPSLNNDDPPVGAPEGATRNKQVNDIIRYMMAAIREIGDYMTGLSASLKGMAFQDPSNINITGGAFHGATIYGDAYIHAEAIKEGTIDNARLANPVPNSAKLAGNSIQEIYDAMIPVGTIRMTAAHVSAIAGTGLPVPAGVVAFWSQMNFVGHLKVLDNATYTGAPGGLQTGGNNDPFTTGQGAHAHGGTTVAHTLTTGEIPPHTHSVPSGGLVSGQTVGYRTDGTQQNSVGQTTGQTGGGAGHAHGINGEGNHQHQVHVDPFYIAVQAWWRVS